MISGDESHRLDAEVLQGYNHDSLFSRARGPREKFRDVANRTVDGTNNRRVIGAVFEP